MKLTMKILVIWDYIEDIYHNCISKPNPEWTYPTYIECSSFTVWGWAAHVRDCLESLEMDVDFLFSKFWYNRKHRYVDWEKAEVAFRVDDEKEFMPLDEGFIAELDNYSLIIVSDYNKWTISKEFAEKLPKNKLIVDTKPNHFDWFKWAYIIKPNRKEFMSTWLTQEEFVKKYDCNLFLTLWEDGAEVYTRDWQQRSMKALNANPVSVCWAWDAFLSWMVYWLTMWWIYNALLYWSLCSAISCSHARTNCPVLADVMKLKWELGL